ncbi:MAG TPA: hypothetical protein PLJ38_01900 [bacterium]|nr:hypothetical protein [bacterium]
MRVLSEIKKEKEESKKQRIAKEKIYQKLKEIDVILRVKPMNSFEKVYISLAIQKIIEELAINYSLGKVEYKDENDIFEIDIINPQLTTTDLKNILYREKQNHRIYSLFQALKEMDDFQVTNNPAGSGILIKVFKKINKDKELS